MWQFSICECWLLLYAYITRPSYDISSITKTTILKNYKIRSVERGICPIAETIMTDTVIFQCACAKLPYFCCRMMTISQTCDFSIFFQNSDRRHLGFLKFRNLTVESVKRSNCVTMPNFVAMGQTDAEIWRFYDFSRWRPPPSWIFKFSKF